MNKDTRDLVNRLQGKPPTTNKNNHHYFRWLILLILIIVFHKTFISILGGVLIALLNPFTWATTALIMLFGLNDD